MKFKISFVETILMKSEFICYYYSKLYAGESSSNELFPSGFSCNYVISCVWLITNFVILQLISN